MARAQTPHLLRGKVGNLIYRVVNGKQIVQQAPDPHQLKQKHKARMAQDSKFANYRGNILEFAGASKIACDIYKTIHPLCDELGPIFRPYSQNYLTACLKQAVAQHNEHDGTRDVYATAFTLQDGVRAFRGLDLSRETAPSEMVGMIPMGPQHNPTAIKILGLEKAAAAIPTNGNARLELRFHIRQAEYTAHHLNQDQTWIPADNTYRKADGTYVSGDVSYLSDPSDWIPAEIIPTEGFTIDLPKEREGATYITVIAVEWREIRTVGRRVVHHHEMGIVRIASVHGPAEAFISKQYKLNYTPSHAHAHALKPLIQNNQDPDETWRTDPKAFIAKVLAKLTPK